MLERGFDLRATVEILNTEERPLKEHLLQKIDAAVRFDHVYDLVWYNNFIPGVEVMPGNVQYMTAWYLTWCASGFFRLLHQEKVNLLT